MIHHWGVDVRINGKNVLTIESKVVFGKAELTTEEQDAIRNAAEHLLAFVGAKRRRPEQKPGG